MNDSWIDFQYYQYKLIKEHINSTPPNRISQTIRKVHASALNNLGYNHMNKSQFDLALKFYRESLSIAVDIKDYSEISTLYNNIGMVHRNEGDLPKALKYYKKALGIRKNLGDIKGIALSLNNIGYIYGLQGILNEANKYYLYALKLREQINDKSGIALSLNNIGYIYSMQGELDKAIEFTEKSLKIRLEIGDKRAQAFAYNSLGSLYSQRGDLELAKKSIKNSLAIREKTEDIQGVAHSINSLGLVYEKQKKFDKALDCYYRALKIREDIGDDYGKVYSCLSISKFHLTKKDIYTAKEYAKKSLTIAERIGLPDAIQNSSLILSEVYEKQGKGLKSLEMYKLYITMRDSIYNDENQKSITQQQAKYEYEKQKAIDDAEHNKLLAIEQEGKKKQKILTYAIAGGLGLVVVFLLFVFNRLQVTKKQKLVIEEQKLEVEKQKEEVEIAHSELEEKNKEITDSINYAKRIQNAILPPAKVVKEYLKESFILYKPKDIVAGDFYWLEQKDGKVLFAAADCTGHGVPGAMVSVVCNNALNRSVREHGLTDPGKILDKTREIVVAEFEKSDEEVQDGMDIALCSLEGNKLHYAGAHNPLWIIRSGEIIETKANKQPIGKFDNPLPYTTHTFDLQKGDAIYIFSDGYVDQFGGQKGKKFKTRAYRKLLLSIQDRHMEDQKIIIDDSFETWKGNLEQIDDVCVIGVRI